MSHPRATERSPAEDPYVAPVEAHLAAAAAPYEAAVLAAHERPRVEHALWVCACVSDEDAPTWLIHDTADGGVAWCRVPVGLDIPDLVDARRVVGGHTSAEALLRWLDGRDSRPGGDVEGEDESDEVVLDVLGRLLIRR